MRLDKWANTLNREQSYFVTSCAYLVICLCYTRMNTTNPDATSHAVTMMHANHAGDARRLHRHTPRTRVHKKNRWCNNEPGHNIIMILMIWKVQTNVTSTQSSQTYIPGHSRCVCSYNNYCFLVDTSVDHRTNSETDQCFDPGSAYLYSGHGLM